MILPVHKNRDPVPSPAAAALPRISGILLLASGPPPAVTIAPFRDGRISAGAQIHRIAIRRSSLAGECTITSGAWCDTGFWKGLRVGHAVVGV
jgi:hypothetical protein